MDAFLIPQKTATKEMEIIKKITRKKNAHHGYFLSTFSYNTTTWG